MSDLRKHGERPTASQLDDAFLTAKSLEADDRLRLIARLWASLPAEHWAAPSEHELAQIEQRLNDFDTDGLAEVPWKIVRQMTAERARLAVPTKIYSAPRRFDLATIFVVTFAYSLLFALLSFSNAPPVVSVMIGGFITMVGIGQALMFGGHKPRAASIVTGSVTYVVIAIAYWIYEDRVRSDEFIIIILLTSLVFGGVAGYIAGVFVGGVFLVADVVRQFWKGRNDAEDQLVEVELTPIPDLSFRTEQSDAMSLGAEVERTVAKPPSG